MKFGSKEMDKKSKVIGSLRKAQLVTTFGCGSIVDLPDYSVIIAATDYWGKKGKVIHEPNLERLLGMKYFQQPQAIETDSGYPGPDIPAFRFPTYHFCPGCNRLMPYKKFGDENGIRCPVCKNRSIVPSRFVAACINGHIEDFPYKWWVHKDINLCPEKDSLESLKIYFSSASGGLSSIIVECTACGAKRSLEGSMGREALRGYKCKGHRPWIGHSHKYDDPEPCSAQLRTLQRGGSNVHYGITSSALTIPPWSSKIFSEISERKDKLESFLNSKPSDDVLKTILDFEFKELISTGFCTINDLLDSVKKFFDLSSYQSDFNENVLYEQEYRALCTGNIDDPEFTVKSTPVSAFLSSYISDVVLVQRLREVLALRGFRRIFPSTPSTDEQENSGYNGNEFVPVSNQLMNWLPAIELLGEGIFIKLNEESLLKWEQIIGTRYEKMGIQLADGYIGRGRFSPRYVLLHTLAHLIIRQLTMECGYSVASIKERIYSTYNSSTFSMAGILIYTSSSDSDGSLGGLVRMGAKERFENMVRGLLQEASWCSSDPICSQSLSQGFDSLNYAACHACSLLPETSCESRNCLLDRVSVVGTSENHRLGYLGELLEK